MQLFLFINTLSFLIVFAITVIVNKIAPVEIEENQIGLIWDWSDTVAISDAMAFKLVIEYAGIKIQNKSVIKKNDVRIDYILYIDFTILV